MIEDSQVEMQSGRDQRAWGKDGEYQSGEKFKLTSTSVFWILAPVFLILPWIIYLRNRDAGVRPEPHFEVPSNASSREQTMLIPEISTKSSIIRPRPIASAQSFTALKIVGAVSRNIPPGSQVKGILTMGASNGPVKVKTTESLVLAGDVLLESGVTFIGQAQSGEDRLFVTFNKLVMRDGTTKQMAAQGYDVSDMIPGLKGSKVRSRLLKFGAAASLNFLGGLSEGLQETQVNGGVPVRNNSLRNAALNGASRAALDQGKNMLESAQNDQDVIEVKVNTPLWVVFGGEN